MLDNNWGSRKQMSSEELTRIETVNLGKAWLTPRYRRTDRVVNMIRDFAKKHMKSDDIKLDQDLNRQIWKRGKTNPPRRARLRMVKDDDGTVVVSLYEEADREETKRGQKDNKLTGSENDADSSK